jgi:tetratricopeptide (TPR) repeat protein
MQLETEEDIRQVFKTCSKDYSEANKKLAFKCIQKAKWLKNPELEFEARDTFIGQAVFLNYKEEAISMFARQIEYADSREINFVEQLQLLWSYKWIMNALPEFSNIPKARIESIFDDFKKRVTNSKWAGNTVEHYKYYLAFLMGRPDQALEILDKLEPGTSQGVMNDCKACEIDGSLNLLIDTGRYDKVEKLVEPIIAGKLTCKDVPRRTHSKLVRLYYLKGNWDLAEKYDALVKKDPKEKLFKSGSYSRVLPYWGVSKKWIRGIEVISHQMTYISDRVGALSKFDFYLACSLFFRGMKSYQETWAGLSIDFSSRENSHTLQANKAGQYSTSSLEEWFGTMAAVRAQNLDKRNENDFYTVKLDKETKAFDQQLALYLASQTH